MSQGIIHNSLITLEVFSTVFSLIVILLNLSISFTLLSGYNSIVDSSSYTIVQNEILNFEIVQDVVFLSPEKNETDCPTNYFPYPLLEIAGINNTCVEYIENEKVLTFEKSCQLEIVYNESEKVIINDIFGLKMCYLTFPKSEFVFYFRNLTDKCEDGDFVCGTPSFALLCLGKTDKILKCPIVDLEIKPTEEFVDFNPLYTIITNISLDNLNSKKSNISIGYLADTDFHDFRISFKLKWKLPTEIPFYEYLFYNTEEEIKNKSKLNITEIFNEYNNNYLNNKNNYFDLNPYAKLKISNMAFSKLDLSPLEFASTYSNLTADSNVVILYSLIDPHYYFTLATNYIMRPNDNCIDNLFLKNSENNSRGFFAVLSDISFNFLRDNITTLNMWILIQTVTFFICAFCYRIPVLSEKINNIYTDLDAKNEKITMVVLKFFIYFSIICKITIIFNIDSKINHKIDFISYIVENSCFANYFDNNIDLVNTYLGTESLTHLWLEQLKNLSSLTNFLYKMDLLKFLTLLEILNEVFSVIVYNLITNFNHKKKTN